MELKTTKMNDNGPDIYNKGYMHQWDIYKIFYPMEHLSNDHKDRSNQQENKHKLCDKKGHPFLSLKESRWKLRQQHDHNFTTEGKPL